MSSFFGNFTKLYGLSYNEKKKEKRVSKLSLLWSVK